MTDIAHILKKGALVGQNPAEFETVEGLEEIEKQHLRDEVLRKCMFEASQFELFKEPRY